MERAMISHEELGKEVAHEQDQLINSELQQRRDLEEAKARLFSPSAVELREQSSFGKKQWILASAAAFAVAAMLALVFAAGWNDILFDDSASLEEIAPIPGTWYASSDSSPKPLEFVDGSRITLGQSSGMRVIDTTKKGARVLLEYGEADVKVAHKKDTNWLMEVGPFAIHVVGTIFSVKWNPQKKEFNLKMEEGIIEIDGPIVGQRHKINAGDTVTIWLSQGRMELISGDKTVFDPDEAIPDEEKPAVATAPTETDGEQLSVTEPEIKKENRGTPQKPWQELAKQGRYGDIYSQAQKMGMDKVLNQASASELMVLGDTARLLGKWRSANKTYHSIRKRFPGTALSSTAAFALGKMAYDRQKLFGKASKWLGIYLAEQNRGPLVQEALGRLMESKKRTGDIEGAKATAKRYLAEYPNGPYAPKANDLITPTNGLASSK